MAKPKAMKRRLSQWIWLLIFLPTMGWAQTRSVDRVHQERISTIHPHDSITFLSFEVKPAFPGYWLQWKVESEKPIRYFYIERSSDEGRFALSGGIMATPQRNQYNFVDMLPDQGAKTYDFQVEVLFQDGTKAYSAIFRVYPRATQQLKLYPNPGQDYLWLQSPQSPCEDCIWTLYDRVGKVLKHTAFPLAGKTKIDLSLFEAGQYLLMLTSAATHQSWIGRFIKE